ncbi:hypothetical protein WJX81_006425 [Elliptochloris bilobata]|uniref:DUF2235 domain-containing protein n=1 Tax=Elliptochloris bilobata TaxID=381761 RepID=A0AAW1SJF7_9CHLO
MREQPIAELRILKGLHGTNKVHWLESSRCQGVAVLFGGDRVGSAPQEVLRLQDVNTQAALVRQRWPGCSVAIVAPSRLEANFACYDHFLAACTRSGEPLGYKGRSLKACLQMWSLLRALSLPDRGDERSRWPPVRLLGFSKGCVVVNQVLAEIAYLEGLSDEAAIEHLQRSSRGAPDVDLPDMLVFVKAIREVLLLDAGLNCRGAYLTDPEAAAGLGRWCRRAQLRVSLHGTPRQWGCSARPWIAEEKDRCMALLAAAGVPVKQRLHFAGQEPSLLMHFRILEAFEF